MTQLAEEVGSVRRDATVIGLVGVAHFLSHFFQIALAPMFLLLRQDFDVSYTALGAVVTTFYVVSGVAQAFAGIFVDRYGARPLLLAGLALMAVSTLAYGLVPQFWMLYPLAALSGLGNSVFHPADMSILSTRVSRPRLGRAYSVHALSGTLGYAVSPAVVGGIALATDWRTALVAAGLLGFAACALLLRFGGPLGGAGPVRDEQPQRPVSYASLLTTPAIMMAFGYFALTAAAGIGVQTFAVTTLVKLYGVTLDLAAPTLTAYLLGSAAGILTGGVIADRTTRHAAVAVTGIGIAAALMLLVGTNALPFAGVFLVITLAGFAGGATAPSRDLLVRAATPPGATGKVFGFVYSGLDLGSSTAPVLFGFLLDHDRANLVFAGVAILLAATVPTVLQVRRQAAKTA
jgi:MFS family permease